MTLDDVIKDMEDSATLNEYQAQEIKYMGRYNWEEESAECLNLSKYRRQLAEWLKELKQLRKQAKSEKKTGKWIWKNAIFWKCNF